MPRLRQVLMHLSVIPEVIASLQIDCNRRVREMLEIDRQDLLRHVIVVQFVVAQGHVHIEGKVLPVVQEDPLVNVDGFLDLPLDPY